MFTAIGVGVLIIVMLVLDVIRYKHKQTQRIKDAEDTQRYITNNRNGWNNNTLSNVPDFKIKKEK